MNKEVSLILAPGWTVPSIMKASRESRRTVEAILKVVDPPQDEYHDSLVYFVERLIADHQFNETYDFNRKAGAAATWILASAKVSWYMRRCSVSMFIDVQEDSASLWSKYTTDWKKVTEDIMPEVDITNSFVGDGHSLGCLISPTNSHAFITDYHADADFKRSVDKHFGMFTAGLFEAMYASVTTNTDLIEASDVFVVSIPDPQSGRLQYTDQKCYTTHKYQTANIALQAHTQEIEILEGHSRIQQRIGDPAKAESYLKLRQEKIDFLLENGNKYIESIRKKTNLDIPYLTEDLWQYQVAEQA